MINVFPAAERHSADLGWLRSFPSYSFGDYYDPNRTGFGVMRVCNDDYLAPGRGFGAHPHSDMEIVSIVLNGRIRHEDSLGNNVVSSFGEVQRMSAGSGVIHTEFNASDEEELRLLQLWFMPKERGTAPSYEASSFDVGKLHNVLLPVVSAQASERVAWIGQDLTIYLSRLGQGERIVHVTDPDRKLFLFAIEGSLRANGVSLGEGDTAQIERSGELELVAGPDAFLMLVDMPAQP
ncbi:pirin family protein [Paenibacillus arenilitoris]|uniref:Pirin family protein n=1 Tax=Paenibacillus arenilitoris TaxID=2772299 RepID=A0A927CK65_9BACL|nr:pirin family protein [Paenibacillus arenilitoris]MBD2868222.1 pirin family protein [Paenibacillus arenilitoris]